MTTSFQPKRVIKSILQRYTAPPDKVFPLLCPVREYEWIEVWKCEMVWSGSGVAENNCVFTTDFPDVGGREVWVVCRYEPGRAIEFVRMSNNEKIIRLDIHLEQDGEGATIARWTHTYTGLDAAGNSYIEKISDQRYVMEMRLLEKMLNHFLETGTMMKGVAGHYRQGEGKYVHHRPDGEAL